MMESLRASAPAILESGQNRPSLVVPCAEETGKRPRPHSVYGPMSSPSPRKKQLIIPSPVVNDAVVSATLLEKKPKQRRWMNRKAPPRKWTAEEDAQLSAAVKEHGAKNWKNIAEYVPNRNHTQCLQRWGKVLAPNLVKGHWTPQEDSHLVALVRELAVEGIVKNWGEVANMITGRTSKQARERWFNHLDPSIKRGNYTIEEDRLIMEEQARIGNRWSIISAMLPGRTEDAVKIRWKTLNRQAKNGGKPTPRKPRKERKPKLVHSNIPPSDPGLASPPPFPISESVKRMIADSVGQSEMPAELKVDTSLPNMLPAWNQVGAAQPAVSTEHRASLPGPYGWADAKPAKPEILRYRAESLEWLEDALLSPLPKPPMYKMTPETETAGVSIALVAKMTPLQTCHQAASMRLPSITPSNLKDEDLDHFLSDMDLDNLGGALENRLSFG